MRRRWAWLATGSGIVATTTSIACGPTETTCEESATCPTGAAGADGSSMDGGRDTGGGSDVGVIEEDSSTQVDADAVAPDTVTPPEIGRASCRERV